MITLVDSGMDFKQVLSRIVKLRCLTRTGWEQSGIPPALAENVAEHSFLTASISLLMCERLRSLGAHVDTGRCLAMALVHDWPEAVTGDIPLWTSMRMRPGERRSLEKEALSEMGSDPLIELLEEFNERSTRESRVARVSDLIATAIQAEEYARSGFREAADIGRECLRKAFKISSSDDLLAIAVKELLSGLTLAEEVGSGEDRETGHSQGHQDVGP